MESSTPPDRKVSTDAKKRNEAVSSSAPATRAEVANILLVDDEPRNLDVLESILNLPIYRLVRAQTADEALMALVHDDFACIVLDIRIPGMSGLELARLIKTRRRCQHVPIIFLTAFFQEEKDVLQGYDVGAVDYLTKPVNPLILKSKVGVFVELFQTTRALKTANESLEQEIGNRLKAEEALRQSNAELEARVNERTSELTTANRSLSASERRYRELVQALPAALYTCDIHGRIVLYNDAAIALWGREPRSGDEFWCGSHQIYRPDGTPVPLDSCPMAIALKEGRPVRGEEIIIERPDGTRRYVLPHPEPIRDESGAVVGAMNMLVDITERKEVEEALRKSEERLRLALQTGRVGVWDWNLTTNYISWSDSLFAIHGLDQNGSGGMTVEDFLKLIHPDERSLVIQAVENSLKDDVPFNMEFRVIRPDGKIIWLFNNAKILREQGKAVRMTGATMEITEHKEAEEVRAHLAAIIESSQDAIISKDLNGIIQTWNHGAELIFGYSAAEAIGQPIMMLIPPDHQAEEIRILETLRQGKRIDLFETVRIRKDGRSIEVSLAISPVKDMRGRIVGASKICRDITRQKRAEQALERAHQEVLAASRAKDDFLAALSHELRTPLNPVLLLASEAAQDPSLPPALREKFDLISKNVSLEARLIDDLLDLTRITRGKLKLEIAPVDAHSVLYDALAVVQPEIEQKQIALKIDLAAERHLVWGDAVRLQQVFWNVLKNAAKFTPEGGRITIATETATQRGEFSLQITDTGIGMAAEDINRIFEPFSQGDHGDKRSPHRFGGLGLGLAISRKLMELHLGQIRASSPGRNQGATFSIQVPLASEGDIQKAPGLQDAERISASQSSRFLAAGARIRVLLVEDHEATRNALAQLLRRRRYEVVTAASIKEARAHASTGDFHLLISDIGLPDGSGNELMAELRQQGELRGIALTGYGMDQDIAGTRNAGFGAHLTKPVRIESLEEALVTVLCSDVPS